MTSTAVVSNASPLIALEQLFRAVVIPSAVAREVAPTIPELPAWISERPLTQPIGPRLLRPSLGAGESETISLALELTARLVILDDRPARRLALGLGLSVIGTLGILLAVWRRGFLPAVRPAIDALIAVGFHVAPALHQHVLVDAGESE